MNIYDVNKIKTDYQSLRGGSRLIMIILMIIIRLGVDRVKPWN